MAIDPILYGKEPIGAEAAIGWHLRQIDWHDLQESCAEACDMPECTSHHEAMRKAHKARLAELEGRYPETAKICRDQYEVECSTERADNL